MAVAATNSTTEPRSFSIGPKKIQILRFTAVSGDTTGTLTADALTYVDEVILSGGIRFTAAPTIAGNVVTLAFTDPSTGGYFGTVICIGR